MRLAAPALLLMLTAAPLAAQDDMRGSNGAFPVFGPSEEREAFFAAQEAERQRKLEEIRKEQAAAAAEARARAAAERERSGPDADWLSRANLYPTVICTPVPKPEGGFRRECRTVYRHYDGYPRPFLLPPPPPRTELELRFSDEGVSGRLEYRAPGMRLGFGTD